MKRCVYILSTLFAGFYSTIGGVDSLRVLDQSSNPEKIIGVVTISELNRGDLSPNLTFKSVYYVSDMILARNDTLSLPDDYWEKQQVNRKDLREKIVIDSQTGRTRTRPSPFSPTLSIIFETTGRESVCLRLYDINGIMISQLFQGILDAGIYRLHMDVGDYFNSGLYLIRSEIGGNQEVRKIVLLK